MKLTFLSVCLLACMNANAKPLDAEGPCPTQRPIGTISRADRGQKPGAPWLTQEAQGVFKAAHAAGTAGEDAWLSALSGKSGAKRRYREGAKDVLVVTVCDAADCDRHRAYVVFEPASGAWGATVIEGGRLREIVQGAADTTLAMHPQILANALICAINTDAGGK